MQAWERTFALDDIEIQRGGDGRTVTAYAAVFDTPAEIRDAHGHYNEVISRTAFAKTLRERGPDRVSVMYNHALTEYGTPSDLGSVPVARCLEIKPDGKGLLTVSRYNMGEFADSVLEAIRNGAIRGQSFRGGIYQSHPAHKAPRVRAGQPLPTITRTELGLTEYGPTRSPAYTGAEIVAVRSAGDLAAELENMPADELRELIRTLSATLPPAEPDAPATETNSAGELEPQTHSATLTAARARLRRALVMNGVRSNG